MSLSTMIAPSILASSRRPVAVKGTSRVKPPVEIESTVLSWPSTIRAPVRPRRIRSSPSRSGVPGAIEARVARSRSCSSMRSATGPPRSVRRAPVHRRVKCRGAAERCQSGGVSPSVEQRAERRRRPRPPRRPSTVAPARDAALAGERAAARHDGHLEAQPGGLGDALRQVADPAQLAGQPDLADRDGAARRGGTPRWELATATAIARSAAGSWSLAPPTVATKVSLPAMRSPAWRWSTARTMSTRERSTPETVRRGRSSGDGVSSACTSASSGRRPSIVTATQVPETSCGVVLDEEAGRVGRRPDALGGQVEAADLVDRAVAVLHRADHAEAGVAVALEVEDDVDEVLEHARAGDRAVLGHVADEHRGDVAGLGDPDQRGRDLLDLGDAAGHAVDAGGADGLHGVDHQQRRPDLLDVGEHRAEVGLGGEEQLVVDAAGAVGAQPHLRRGLLAGDVEGARGGSRAVCAATSSSSVLLPTPGSPASRIAAPGTSPPPSTRSSSGTPLVRATDSVIGDLPDRHGRAWRPGTGGGAQRRGAPPRRPTPRPGTRRSDRPTWRSPSRTRSSGRRSGPWRSWSPWSSR